MDRATQPRTARNGRAGEKLSTPIEAAIAAHLAYDAAADECWRIENEVGRSYPDARRARAHQYARHEEWRQAFNACAVDFAKQRGWTVAKKAFFIHQLQRGRNGERGEDFRLDQRALLYGNAPSLMDHCQYFRGPAPHFRPVAIITHSYELRWQRHVEFTEKFGLVAEPLPISWYYPGRAFAVLYARREENQS